MITELDCIITELDCIITELDCRITELYRIITELDCIVKKCRKLVKNEFVIYYTSRNQKFAKIGYYTFYPCTVWLTQH